MAATELKSVEFVFYSKEIIEIFDVQTDFTAGRMLHLYRSITQLKGLAEIVPMFDSRDLAAALVCLAERSPLHER